MSLQDQTIYPWRVLEAEAKPIARTVVTNWNRLLTNKHNEQAYHRFIAKHAGFFLLPHEVLISKVKLGSDHVPDFVLAVDQASYGVHYEFIELESPHRPVYTRAGQPSSHLTGAEQQVRDWRAWLKENRGQAKKLFPSYDSDNFGFSIVIGRRNTHDNRRTLKRNDLSRRSQIRIRSFDFLTWRLRNKCWSDCLCSSLGAEVYSLSRLTRNRLANPFAEAYSWASWREIALQRRFNHVHFIPLNADLLLRFREYHKANFNQFLSVWESLPQGDKDRYLRSIDWD